MKGATQRPVTAGKESSGVVLFDEYIKDEDFLEFLVEWSDSIVQNDSCNSTSPGSRETPLKRKIDDVSTSSIGGKESNMTSDLDASLVKLPTSIFNAFNTGNLQHLREIIKERMTTDCLFKTMMIAQPLVGRHIYTEFWSKLSVSHPDMVFILKKVRLTNNLNEPKYVKFNYFFTGTNTFPGATETYYYNNDDYLIKNLDSSKYTEKEKNAVNLLVAQHRAHGTPYVAFGRGTGSYEINHEGKVCSISFEWKLTSIRPPFEEVT